MKTIVSYLLTIFVFTIGCQSDGEDEVLNNLENNDGERWELVRSINAWTGEVTEGDALTILDFYIFNDDNTFVKFNPAGDTVTGTYQRSSLENGEGDELRLTFLEESLLRNSCLAGQEYLIIRSDTLINDARACDGPQLIYTKKPTPTDQL